MSVFNEQNVKDITNMLRQASENVERVFQSGKRVGYNESCEPLIKEFSAELDAIIAVQDSLIMGGAK